MAGLSPEAQAYEGAKAAMAIGEAVMLRHGQPKPLTFVTHLRCRDILMPKQQPVNPWRCKAGCTVDECCRGQAVECGGPGIS